MARRTGGAKTKREAAPIQRAGRVVLVGRPNVGKSTLLNALLGEPIAITSHHPQTTRDTLLGVLTQGGAQFAFVDTPGVHEPKTKLGKRMNAAARDATGGADVVFFLADVPMEGSDVLRPGDREILAALPKKIPVLCLLNKIDRRKRKTDLFPMLQALTEAHGFEAVVPVSAKTGDGLKAVLEEAKKHLPEGDPLYEEDALSDRPVRYFAAEFVREQILRHTRKEVPHGVAVVVERFEDDEKVPRIELAIHVAKESHKAIVIGAGGQLLKGIGTEARARIEDLLGRKVHLTLWVRVTPGWQENDAVLDDLGYGEPEVS